MPAANGVVRFLLFVAVIALIAGGFYANGQHKTVMELKNQTTALTTERDALKSKVEDLTKEAGDAAAKLKEQEAKVTDLQAKIDAMPPPAHTTTRSKK